MPKIPLDISLQGEQKLAIVAQGVYKIADAEKVAGRAAAARVRAQSGHGSGNERTGSGGAHGGFMGALHAAGRGSGGEFGHLAHRGSALGHLAGFGVMGMALGAAGIALNSFTAGMERAAAQAKETFEMTHQFAEAMFKATESRGKMGQGALGEEGGIRELLNKGLFSAFRNAQSDGFGGSAESFAGLGGSSNRLKAVTLAHQLGTGFDQAAEIAKHISGDADPGAAARFITSQARNRVVTDDEFNNAIKNNAGRSNITSQLNQANLIQAKMSSLKVDNLKSGAAVTTMRTEMAAAASPETAMRAELQKKIEHTVEILEIQSQASGTASEMLKQLWLSMGVGEGSFEHQANQARLVGAAAQQASQ